MKKNLLALAALLLLAPVASLAAPLETAVILDLLDAGVSNLSIQRYVERNDFTFDLSSQDLVALKRAGASDDLILFLQDREETPSRAAEKRNREEYDSPEYGVGTYTPYYYGYAYGYPYFYSGFYYPYYYPYYSYYSPYPYYYPYYSSDGGHGSGVVSYWYDRHSGGTVSPDSSTRPAPQPRRRPPRKGGGHPRR